MDKEDRVIFLKPEETLRLARIARNLDRPHQINKGRWHQITGECGTTHYLSCKEFAALCDAMYPHSLVSQILEAG